MIFLKSLDKVARSTGAKPIWGYILCIQGFYQTERIKHILGIFAEMIAIIISLQFGKTIFVRHAESLAKSLNIGFHHCGKFRHAYAADG